MTNLDRKTTILLHIQKYCTEIEENFKFFGTHLEVFKDCLNEKIIYQGIGVTKSIKIL